MLYCGNYDIVFPSECWIWNYLIDKKGRPRFEDGKKIVQSICIIYKAHKGEIPRDYTLRQTCTTNLCVNPDHWESIPMPNHTISTPKDIIYYNNKNK